MEVQTLSRKEQIKQIAQNMFRERGYSATGMRDLAREVGIEPASLYNHIKSKEDILQDICFGIADDFFKAQDAANKVDSADKRLRDAMIRHVGVIVQNLDASSVFFNEWKHLSEPDLSRFKSLRTNYEWLFRDILKDGMQSGIFKNMDVKLVTFTIFSALNATYDLYKPQGERSWEEIAESIASIILKGIAK